jgi:hypothetical protein
MLPLSWLKLARGSSTKAKNCVSFIPTLPIQPRTPFTSGLATGRLVILLIIVSNSGNSDRVCVGKILYCSATAQDGEFVQPLVAQIAWIPKIPTLK